jgi:hypothetical protein
MERLLRAPAADIGFLALSGCTAFGTAKKQFPALPIKRITIDYTKHWQ